MTLAYSETDDSKTLEPYLTTAPGATYTPCDEHGAHHSKYEHFTHIYMLFAFLIMLWIIGKLCDNLGVPPILGYIILGIVLGPELGIYYHKEQNQSIDSYVAILKSVGEMGLLLIVMEAGVEVDAHVLKLIGFRGLGVALCGSGIPVSIGLALAMASGAESFKQALAIGACWAPASMGIALACLKGGNALNTMVGQLVVASAVLKDIISLILLGLIKSMSMTDPTLWDQLRPLVVSVLFVLFGGVMAFKVMPVVIPWYLSFFDPKHQTYTLLCALFVTALIMIPAVEFAGSSMLLGAFLSGLMFSSEHDTHHVYVQQLKRIMAWLLRVFFAATIGFEVPIKDIWTATVIGNAFLFFVPVFGKFLTGLWVPGRKFIDMCKLGFAMSMRGEFAFILAKASLGDGVVTRDQFGSIVMSVLLSIITGPLLLNAALKYDNKNKESLMGQIEDDYLEPVVDGEAAVARDQYIRVITKSKGYWGFYERMESVLKNLKLEVLDYRTSHVKLDGHHKVLMESFVIDKKVYPTDPATRLQQKELRRKHIVEIVRFELKDEDAQVSVNIWHPKITKKKKVEGEAGDTVLKGNSDSEASEEEGCLYISKKFKKRSAIKANKSIARAMHQMASHGLEGLVAVVEEFDHHGHKRHKVVGMITQQEIFESMDHEVHDVECSKLGTTKHYLHDHKYTDNLISDHMIPVDELVLCTRDQSRAEILGAMGKNNMKHMLLKNHLDNKQVDYLLNIVSLLSHMAVDHMEQIQNKIKRDKDSRNSVFETKEGKSKTFEKQFRQLSINFGQALDWNANNVDLAKLTKEMKSGKSGDSGATKRRKSRRKSVNFIPPEMLTQKIQRLPSELKGPMNRDSMIVWDAYQLAQNFVPPEEEMIQMQNELHEKLHGARRSIVFAKDKKQPKDDADGVLPSNAMPIYSPEDGHSDGSLGSFEAETCYPQTESARSQTPEVELEGVKRGVNVHQQMDGDSDDEEAEFQWGDDTGV